MQYLYNAAVSQELPTRCARIMRFGEQPLVYVNMHVVQNVSSWHDILQNNPCKHLQVVKKLLCQCQFHHQLCCHLFVLTCC